MRALITGGFGYLGGRLAQTLCDAGVNLVLGSRKEQKSPDWLPQATTAKLVWDDQEDLRSVCEQVDVVIHAAGMNAQDCANDPAGAMEFNGGATARLIQASAIANVKKFIYLSTTHVYCAPLIGEITEDTCPSNSHPYAVSHRAAEDLLLHHISKNNDMVGIVLRLSNGVGAPVHIMTNCWGLAINDFCRQLVANGLIVVHSPPNVQRDFVPISVLCGAVSSILNSDNVENSVINVTSSNAKNLHEIVGLICARSELVLDITPEVMFESRTDTAGNNYNLSISNNKLSKIVNINSNLEGEVDQLLMKCKEWFG